MRPWNEMRKTGATSELVEVRFYDGWNLIEERIAYTNGNTSTIHYYWGKDLSGTLQGAGVVGGLRYLFIDGAVHIPCYDNNGNITRYLDANGNAVAHYVYNAFKKLTLIFISVQSAGGRLTCRQVYRLRKRKINLRFSQSRF